MATDFYEWDSDGEVNAATGGPDEMAWSPNVHHRRLHSTHPMEECTDDPYSDYQLENAYVENTIGSNQHLITVDTIRGVVRWLSKTDRLSLRLVCKSLKGALDCCEDFWAENIICPPQCATTDELRKVLSRVGAFITSYRHSSAGFDPAIQSISCSERRVPQNRDGVRVIDFEGACEMGIVAEACPNLVHLDLSNTHVTGALLEIVGNMSKLCSLYLRNCRNCGGELGWICKMTRSLKGLVDISIDGCSTTAGDLEQLATLPKLKRISLSRNTTVNDSLLENFTECSELESIDLSYCENISNAGVMRLCERRPIDVNLNGCRNLV